MSLSRFRGKVVVLEFMDPHCHNICPIVSQEFIDAYHDLGRAAGAVVFAAVNVNPYHARVLDVRAFSVDHRLTTIPGWHFFTGASAALRASGVITASRCRCPALTPTSCTPRSSTSSPRTAPNAISPRRWTIAPVTGRPTWPPGQLADWGQGIALVARNLTG